MIKIQCQIFKFDIPLDKEEAIYEKYLLCLCGNMFINPNFINENGLNEYLERMNKLYEENNNGRNNL